MTTSPGNPFTALARTISGHGKRIKVAEQRIVNLETKLAKAGGTLGSITPAQMTALATLTAAQLDALQTLSVTQIDALNTSTPAQLLWIASLSSAQQNFLGGLTTTQTNFLDGLTEMGGAAWSPMTSNTASADGAAAWQVLNALLAQLQGNGYHA
jgi:hypothetical protein